MSNYIPAEDVRIFGEYRGVLLIKRRGDRIAESGVRIPDGMSLDDMRRLHAEHRLRFMHHDLSTEPVIGEPAAPGVSDERPVPS